MAASGAARRIIQSSKVALMTSHIPQIPDSVNVKCSDLKVGNPTPCRNKEHCCREAKAKHVPELCGQVNASAIYWK